MMTDRVIAFNKRFYEWLSSFGVAVYRGVLPSGESTDKMYIQYNGYTDGFGKAFIMPLMIYNTNTTSFYSILQIAEQISTAVSEGGLLVRNEDVAFKIEKGSPYYQDRADENPTTKSGYINLEITIY